MPEVPGGRLRSLGLLPVALVAALMWSAAPVSAADPVIGAAGDIACDPMTAKTAVAVCHQQETSDLLVNHPGGLAAVLPVGDLQYECGGAAAFNAPGAYGQTWGRLKPITFPVPGNHEYYTSATAPIPPPGTTWTDCEQPPSTGQAAGYFAYFANSTHIPQTGRQPGKGYYSHNIGAWHLIALNSNCAKVTGRCVAGGLQDTWLKADLAANAASSCTLAYFHHSRFSSKTPVAARQDFWQVLYAAGVDVVLGGHVHSYERFAPQTPTGLADPATGIRQFVVGTGGRSRETFTTVAANSEVRGSQHGVLKLTLHANSYDWQFVPDGTSGNSTFSDSGSGACHGAPGAPDTTPPTVSVTAPTNGATVSGVTTISANAADARGVGRVDFLVDGKAVGTDNTVPYSISWNARTVANGSRTISAQAFDLAGNQSTASVTVTVIPAGVTGGGASSDIYRVGVNGTGLRRITRAPADVDYDSPAWSRNGRRIAFSGASCAGCPGAIFLIQPGGGAQRQLPGTVPGAARPSWSRLDRALTFVGGPTNSVYTISRRGTGQRRLTGGPVAHDQSAWSHDGRQIAYTTKQPNGRWDIFLMRANGAAKRNLTRTPASETQPAWSRNGRSIAFTRQFRGKPAVFVIDVRTRRVRLVAANCQQPAWAPNGRQIACARFSAKGSSVIILRSNGTRQRRLASRTTTAWAPTWSPNGRQIAFTSTG